MGEYLTRFGEPIRYGHVTQRFPLSDYQTIFAPTIGALHERADEIAASGWTDLVVARHPPRAADTLLTGFHDASSTHQWLLNAFADSVLLSEAYAQAAACEYTQHEFGDVHLIV